MRKASITVEAVLVVPLVLMVIFLLLSLTFFVHARSWYTFAAYESTMLAASEGRLSVEKGEAAAQSRMEWWISQIPLPAEPVTVQTVCREKEIQIKAEGNILPIWSRNAWEYSVLSESRRNNPVKTIRKIRAVKQRFEPYVCYFTGGKRAGHGVVSDSYAADKRNPRAFGLQNRENG